MYDDHTEGVGHQAPAAGAMTSDEGGLRAPPHLKGWRKAWWWFDFIILVKLARLRFIAILLVIGVIITQWDTLVAYYDRWTRPASAATIAESGAEYFCPMHPSIIRDNPKEKCPICFMPLSKRKKGAAEAEPLPAGIVNRVQLSPYRIVLAGVGTWPVDYVSLTKDITAVGFIEFNERSQRTVSARVAGRIDKLYANETGQMVNAGDDLALIYSPDLLVTVQSLLDAKRNNNRDLLDSSRIRLERLGVDRAQIDSILSTGQANSHLHIRSPLSGHVINKYVREGEYVEEGKPLYDLADLSTVWIQGQVYEDDLALLGGGGDADASASSLADLAVTATSRAFPNEPFHGKLAFIYPHFDQDSRTVTIRFEVENPEHRLKPGGTATVTVKVLPKNMPLSARAASNPQQHAMLNEGRVLAVPETAVIDTGSQQIVYRESAPGVYDGVEVDLGPRMTDPNGVEFYPVLKGLELGQRVVTTGSFLVDAETRLNPAAGSIYFGGSSGAGGASGATTVRPSTPEDPDAKIAANLAKLADEDRRAAEAQAFCAVLDSSRLGSMGVPVKLTIEGQTVFVCCTSCTDQALKDPKATLAKVAQLKQANSGSPSQ